MDYRLYRGDERGDQRQVLGGYPDYDTALAARNEDALGQLATAAGRRVTVRHVIVGPGLLGPQTEHPVTTAFGADELNPADVDAAVAEARTWLTGIRGPD